jgi:hypothetical protein
LKEPRFSGELKLGSMVVAGVGIKLVFEALVGLVCESLWERSGEKWIEELDGMIDR